MTGVGCTTMPQKQLPRQQPIEAMQKCPELLIVTTGDPLEALSVSIGNLKIHAKCEGWRQTLIKWIKSGK